MQKNCVARQKKVDGIVCAETPQWRRKLRRSYFFAAGVSKKRHSCHEFPPDKQTRSKSPRGTALSMGDPQRESRHHPRGRQLALALSAKKPFLSCVVCDLSGPSGPVIEHSRWRTCPRGLVERAVSSTYLGACCRPLGRLLPPPLAAAGRAGGSCFLIPSRSPQFSSGSRPAAATVAAICHCFA